jgi:tetratricopeptide (TPR) repeat protein
MALGVDPDDASAHNGLGDIALIKGDYDTAIEACTRAIVLRPNYLLAQYDLAEAYYARGKRNVTAKDRLPDALRFVEIVQTIAELNGTPESGSLPGDAQERLATHAKATLDWLMSATGDAPSEDND